MKFVSVIMPNLDSVEVKITNDLFKHLHVPYSDHVTKNPFYSMDMPIKGLIVDVRVATIHLWLSTLLCQKFSLMLLQVLFKFAL